MTTYLLTGDDESILRATVSDLVGELVGDGDRSMMVDEFDGALDLLNGVQHRKAKSDTRVGFVLGEPH